MAEAEASGGTAKALVRAFGSMLGVHIQYARREAKDDIGRVVVGLVLIATSVLFALGAALFAHVALAYYLSTLPQLGTLGALIVVGGGDLAFALVLVLAGRGRLSKPVLVETRHLVKRTVDSFADV